MKILHIFNKNIFSSYINRSLSFFSNEMVRPIDGAPLACFRILFGALMIYEMYRFFSMDKIGRYYTNLDFYFTYELFSWVSPWPEPWIYIHFLAIGLFGFFVMIGLFYRISIILLFLAYTYHFLLDQAHYFNHYYLIILVSFLMIFVDAHKVASVDRLRKSFNNKTDQDLVPYWNIFILQAQIIILYFFGGIAKINADWLAGEPIRMWLHARADWAVMGDFFVTEYATYFYGYGGLLFDLTIGFFLIWRRTRLFAFVAIVFFHLMNYYLFWIGIFPFFGIASIILFVDPKWCRKIFLRINMPKLPIAWHEGKKLHRYWVSSFVILYLIVQIFLPLRHWLYQNHVHWTEEGHRFAWHMKLRSKSANKLDFWVIDHKNGKKYKATYHDYLSPRQIRKMSTRPYMILQFAHHIRDQFIERGIVENPIVRVDSWVSLNGRPHQQLIDPNVDLAKEDLKVIGSYSWILPFKNVPLEIDVKKYQPYSK